MRRYRGRERTGRGTAADSRSAPLALVDRSRRLVESVLTIRFSVTGRRHVGRMLLTGALLLVTPAVAGATSSASTYIDPAGDDNAAPDITAVTLAEAEGVLEVQVEVANYDALPPSSWFNLWFDVDGNTETGDSAGDDALVRYTSDGNVELRLWAGEGFVTTPAAGLTGSYVGGVLRVGIPTSSLGALSSPGILVVGARSSVVAMETLTTADFAPENGRSQWLRGGRSVFPDAEGDQDAAPDITSIRVSDGKDGWIRFAISTPNRITLPDKSLVAVSIDRDANPATGDKGAEVTITTLGGEVELERWDARSDEWLAARPPTRARAASARGVVTIDVHRSELGGVTGFAFRVVSADLNPLTGQLVAVDFAPDSGTFWRYTLANAAAPRLVVGRATGAPARPRAGRVFTIATPVRRSDTNRAITTGSVTCDVRADATRVRATGRVRGGRGQCALLVPPNARLITGSMTIRSGGRTVTKSFRFRVG
jgi:hypothetical protein